MKILLTDTEKHMIVFRNVLVKGGDLPDSLDAVDIFFDGKYRLQNFDYLISCLKEADPLSRNFELIFTGNELYELHSPRIKTRNTHGTGCSLASCIAAELAKGSSMFSAVRVIIYEPVLLSSQIITLATTRLSFNGL